MDQKILRSGISSDVAPGWSRPSQGDVRLEIGPRYPKADYSLLLIKRRGWIATVRACPYDHLKSRQILFSPTELSRFEIARDSIGISPSNFPQAGVLDNCRRRFLMWVAVQGHLTHAPNYISR